MESTPEIKNRASWSSRTGLSRSSSESQENDVCEHVCVKRRFGPPRGPGVHVSPPYSSELFFVSYRQYCTVLYLQLVTLKRRASLPLLLVFPFQTEIVLTRVRIVRAVLGSSMVLMTILPKRYLRRQLHDLLLLLLLDESALEVKMALVVVSVVTKLLLLLPRVMNMMNRMKEKNRYR